MYRTAVFLMTTLALSALGCDKAAEDADANGAAATGTDMAPGIYDGERAVLQISEQSNGSLLYSFAHTFERGPGSTEIIKGAVEAKKGEAPKLRADEIYPCSASVSAEGENVVATGRCRGKDRDFKVVLKPRQHDKLKGTFEANGVSVTIDKSSATGLEVTLKGAGIAKSTPDKGEWAYGGGVYRAYFGQCWVSVVTRSAEKELLMDVGANANAIDIVVSGLECGNLKSGRLAAR